AANGQPQDRKPSRRKLVGYGLIGAAVLGLAVGGVLFGGKIFKSKAVGTGTDNNPNVVLPVVDPRRVEPVPDTEIVTDDGKDYYREIDLILDDGKRIRFILIPKQAGSASEGTIIPTFYIMRDKMSFELFE